MPARDTQLLPEADPGGETEGFRGDMPWGHSPQEPHWLHLCCDDFLFSAGSLRHGQPLASPASLQAGSEGVPAWVQSSGG